MSIIDALIVSKNTIAANQLARMLKACGFSPKVEHNNQYWKGIAASLSVLVTDIDRPEDCGLEIARRHLFHSPKLAWFALCSRDNTTAINQANALMVGGFFFLSESGLTLDSKRGAAQFLCKSEPAFTMAVADQQQKQTNHPGHSKTELYCV